MGSRLLDGVFCDKGCIDPIIAASKDNRPAFWHKDDGTFFSRTTISRLDPVASTNATLDECNSVRIIMVQLGHQYEWRGLKLSIELAGC